MAGRRRPRRAFALATCVLWLLAIEVLPNLHLGRHDDHHTHADDGTIVRLDDDHDHGHGYSHGHAIDGAARDDDHDVDHADDDHADDDHADHDLPDQPAIDHLPRGHAAGGIAHHITALHQPPAPPLAPVDVERMEWRVAAEPQAITHRIGLTRPSARAPPRA